MTESRRDFLKTAVSTTAALGLAGCTAAAPAPAPTPTPATSPGPTPSAGDASIRDLAMLALDAARSAGAQYADVRVNRNRNQTVSTRERRVQGLSDSETFGFGVRVLADGAWGFSASSDLTRDEVQRVARQAVAQAKANRRTMKRPVELAPAKVTPNGTWRSDAKVDPFEISIEDKVTLLLAANEAALGVKGARFVNSSMFFLREDKTLATSEGTYVVQTIFRSSPNMSITAVSEDRRDFQ